MITVFPALLPFLSDNMLYLVLCIFIQSSCIQEDMTNTKNHPVAQQYCTTYDSYTVV